HGVAPHMCGSRHLPIVRPRSRGSLPRLPNYSTLLFAYHVSQDDSSGGSARGIWAGGVAVAMLLDLRVSQAAQMPWCAGTNIGGDTFRYNCTLPTYEMCVQEVIAGNRGFCSPNPYYPGPEFVPPRAKRKRYYY